MEHPDKSDERDPLRGRFTRFIEVMIKRARLNYIERCRRYPETIPIDSVSETLAASDDEMSDAIDVDAFSFEEERLAEAFSKLPLMRQKVLTMLFVNEMSPDEIARQLNCSVGHVYNQRSLALKKLRQLLKEGGIKVDPD